MPADRHAAPLFAAVREFECRVRHNKRLEGTKYFPDFVFLSDWHRKAVVVECDEKRHHTYCERKERHRERVIMDRLRDMGYDCCLIRYDPDAAAGRRSLSRVSFVRQLVKTFLRGESLHAYTWRPEVSFQETPFPRVIVY
jgi:hypothetical protein